MKAVNTVLQVLVLLEFVCIHEPWDRTMHACINQDNQWLGFCPLGFCPRTV